MRGLGADVRALGPDVRALRVASERVERLCVESRALRVAIEGLKRGRAEGRALRVVGLRGLRGLSAKGPRCPCTCPFLLLYR